MEKTGTTTTRLDKHKLALTGITWHTAFSENNGRFSKQPNTTTGATWPQKPSGLKTSFD